MIISGMAVAIVYNSGFYYVIDSHSRNSQGEISVNGVSILMKFRSLLQVENYIQHVYLVCQNYEHLWFQIQLIEPEISKSIVNMISQLYYSDNIRILVKEIALASGQFVMMTTFHSFP